MLVENDFELKNELQRELISGERLLWTGRPRSGLLLRPSDIFLIPFTILWFGFAIFWESTAVSDGAPWFFALWGIPFVLIGAYMCIGRFFYDKKNRDKTIYGITANRILIKSGVFKTTVDSFNIRTLTKLSLTEKSDGSGTIQLARDSNPFAGLNVPGMPNNRKIVPSIESISNVRSVYNLILQQQHANQPNL